MDTDDTLTPEQIAEILAREEKQRAQWVLKTARYVARHPQVREQNQRRYREKTKKQLDGNNRNT